MTKKSTIQEAARIHVKGELVAFPTETVYGLGANAFDTMAVARIFETKERPSFDPLIVHICEIDQLADVYSGHDERVYKLAEKFWPGPLTMVLPKTKKVPDIVTSGLETVAVRMPDNPVALQLINEAKTPLSAPSANKFGRVSPTEADHVRKQFPGLYVIDGGKTKVGIESTVITLHEDGFKILRPGIITAEELKTILPQSANTDTTLNAPGLLKSHYSPEKPIYISDDPCHEFGDTQNAGLISFGKPEKDCGFNKIEVLSETKNLREAAANLFSAMHKLDDADIEFIVAEALPQEGIGIAIMNRLTKAAYRNK